MKKLLLLIAGTILAFGAQAQTPFFSEDFSSGIWGMPSGWSTGTFSGVTTWHYANTASSGGLSIGTIASPTAFNGWMIFDADFTTIGGTTVPSGWLQSPLIDCSTHGSVRLSFSEYYRRYMDSCFVWVGTDPSFFSGTYSSYPVLPNNTLFPNNYTDNPETIHMNISAAAASTANVYVRFVYYGSPGGSYSWLLDDVSLSELAPHDVSISRSFVYQDNITAYNSSIFSTPLAFADTIHPVTLLSNLGASAEASVPVSTEIFRGGTSVFTETLNFTGLASTGYDSVVEFSGYKPNAIGSYSCVFNASLATDADLSNNNDTVHFEITDTTWMVNQGLVQGQYVAYDPAGYARMNGARFDVSSTATSDTLTGFGVSFGSYSNTTGTGTVSVQLYSIDHASTSWTYVGSSVARPVLSPDISTSTTLVWAYFPIIFTTAGSVTPFVLQPGKTYAAVVQMNGVSTLLTINATGAPNVTGYAGFFGQGDTSHNDGSHTFGATTATGNPAAIPLVRLYFGHPCLPPVASVITGASAVCVGSQITLTSSLTSGTWSSVYPSMALVNSAGVVAAVGPGIDTIKYTLVNGCGAGVATHVVTVNPLPYAGVIGGPSAVCVGNTINLGESISGGVWSMSNGNGFISTSGTVLGMAAGADTAVYIVNNVCGADTAVYPITIGVLDHGTISGADTVCVGATITLAESVSGGTWTVVNTNVLISGTGVVAGITPGIDTVKYTVTAACGATTATKVVVVADCHVGVNDVNAAAGIEVYPNPATDGINVRSSAFISKVQVLNVIGQSVYNATGNGNETFIDLKGQPAGTYIIRVNDTYDLRVIKK